MSRFTRRQPTVEQQIADANARNGARDFATALFLMILVVIAIDSTQVPEPTAQPAEPAPETPTIVEMIIEEVVPW